MVEPLRSFEVIALHQREPEPQAADVQAAIERCRGEIQEIEGLLLAGHPDVCGLCLALSDWSAELRLQEADVISDGTAE